MVEVRARLAVLPESQREIAFMRAAGWHYTEIAECLGITKARVNKLLVRADARLRELDQRDLEPQSERAARLSELEQDPPSWLIVAIGRPPRAGPGRGREELRLQWRRLALAIDDFRATHRIADSCRALGSDDPATAGDDRKTLQQRIAGYTEARGRRVDRTI